MTTTTKQSFREKFIMYCTVTVGAAVTLREKSNRKKNGH